MSEKVIKTGLAGRAGLFGGVEVEVPSMTEFNQRIGEINDDKLRLWNEIRHIKENIGRSHEIKDLWRAIDQLTQSPNQRAETPYDTAIRKIYEDIRELERNVWRKEDGRHPPLWDFVGGLKARLDTLETRLNSLPDALRETVREAVRAEFEPLLKPVAENIGDILEDNRKFREEIASLRAEVENLKAISTP